MIGHSMGGAIVTMLVRRRPDLCLGAVVEDPAWLNDEQRQRYVDNAPANAALLHDWASDPANAIRHNQTRRPNWPMEDHIGWAYGRTDVIRDWSSPAWSASRRTGIRWCPR